MHSAKRGATPFQIECTCESCSHPSQLFLLCPVPTKSFLQLRRALERAPGTLIVQVGLMSSPAAQLGQGLPCSPWGWKPHGSDSALGRRERKTSLQGKQMAKTKLGVRWASCLLGKALAGRKQHGITPSLCPNPVSTHGEWDMQLSGQDNYCTMQQCRICLVLHVRFQHAASFHLELTLFQYFLLLFKGPAAIHLPLDVCSPLGPVTAPGTSLCPCTSLAHGFGHSSR